MPRHLFPTAVLAAAAIAALYPVRPARAQPSAPPKLAWPVACRQGVDCEIERYMDDDPSSGAAKDYTCGSRTQDGHEGVDIRLPDMAAQRRGVAVLAAADGRVLLVRDGVDDISVKTTGLAAVDGVNCGNAVSLVHPGGFRTIYCHMAKGSVRVKPGDLVKAGQPIGRIGLSGKTQFPHLHLSLFENDKLVDPFAYGAAPGACGGGRSLWIATPAYKARTIINAGFADTAADSDRIESGALPAPTTASAALNVYVRTVGLKTGDVEHLSVRAPDGTLVISGRSLAQRYDRQETVAAAATKPRPAGGWPSGTYSATYTVVGADGQMVLTRAFTVKL